MTGAAKLTIRAAKLSDDDAIEHVWLLASLQAHDFIAAACWWQQQAALWARYLPDADIWVCERGQEVQGFVALVDDYLAALFVRPDCQQQGIGKALLDAAKSQRAQLLLRVYCENDIAMNFYLKQGFSVIKEALEGSSGQPELYLRFGAAEQRDAADPPRQAAPRQVIEPQSTPRQAALSPSPANPIQVCQHTKRRVTKR